MNDWPVGLSTGCFYQTSIFDCLDAICSSGFSLIEVCSSPSHLDYHDVARVRRVAAKLNALGMEPYSFHAPFAETIDITSLDAKQRENSVSEVLTALEAAALLQAKYFVIHPGPEQADQVPVEERSRRLENVVHSLSIVADRCRRLGMMCVLENKLPHLLFGNIGDMTRILDAMDTPHVGVCLDTGHAHLGGELENAAGRLAGRLRMVHASDNRGEQDDHLPPGEGEIDWMRFFRQLHAGGFQGSVIMEIAGNGKPHHILMSAQRAQRFLRDYAWNSADEVNGPPFDANGC
jgi:sugar phosphate isomerase/epimerase